MVKDILDRQFCLLFFFFTYHLKVFFHIIGNFP